MSVLVTVGLENDFLLFAKDDELGKNCRMLIITPSRALKKLIVMMENWKG